MRLAFLTALVALVAAAPAAAQLPTATPSPTATPTPEPTVQPGVKVAGVDVGGHTAAMLDSALRTTVRGALRVPYELRSSGKRMKLPVSKVEQEFDVEATAEAAFAAAPDASVLPAVKFIRTPIREFVDAFAKAVYVAPVNADVKIHITRIGRTKAKKGRKLAIKRVNALIERALRDPTKRRILRPKLVKTKPEIGAKDLKDRYPSIITVDQSTFTLRLFKRLRYDRQYGVAVGQPAYPTPNGLFAIQSKQVNPTWTAPNSPWAGESAGQSYDSSDPNNPLKARWMGVNGAVGFHGTAQEYSIGTRASHGCMRMRVADVIDLYDRVAVGTPVLIAS